MDQVAHREVKLDTTVDELTDAGDSNVTDVTLRELALRTFRLPGFTPRQIRRRNTWFGLLRADGAHQDAPETVADILANSPGSARDVRLPPRPTSPSTPRYSPPRTEPPTRTSSPNGSSNRSP